ncbi:MAG: chromate efflux transporter [Bacteroidia bacterium]
MHKPSFREAFLFWLKLGFISFGGPAGQIAIMHEFLVEKKKWISESKYLHALNYCMLLPGPEAQQLATYTGWMLHGVWGGIVAGLFFILPSVFILLGLSILYVTFGSMPAIAAILVLLKPTVAAIVIGALIKISKKSLTQQKFIIIAIASFIAIFFFKIYFPIIILTAVIIGFVFEKYFSHLQTSPTKETANDSESEYFINKNTIIEGTGFSKSRLLKQVSTFLILFSIPVVLLYSTNSDFVFWRLLISFFSKAAFVTFGGAYAVLPYVTQYSVENLQWLSHAQMMDGLALGETTPGPLIMVLAFVGFIAGYNHFGNSLLYGTVGLLTTTFYTFLPSFFFILVGAPMIERTHQNKLLKSVLNYVTAAVVGVLANLCVILFLASVLKNYNDFSFQSLNLINAGWLVISIVALQKFKVNMIAWIGITSLAGLAIHLFNII